MRRSLVSLTVASTKAIFPLALAASLGCSISTTDNSITLKTKVPYRGQVETRAATKDWNGESIVVDSHAGSVIVQGDPSVTRISLTVTPVALADGKDEKAGTSGEADAQAALRQVVESIVIDESTPGTIRVFCGQSKGDIGTAPKSGTSCDALTVRVPGGKGIKLQAVAKNGAITATNLAAADGAQLLIGTANGPATATGITGGAIVKSDNGDVTASITPTRGADIQVISTSLGDVDLSLPAAFSADKILFAAKEVKLVGFSSDVTATSTSRGASGTGAANIEARADSSLGVLTVRAF